MPEPDVAEFLHNYGVALLCANQPGRAIPKLLSAYRVGNDQSTLKMLGLAAKIMDWSLYVDVDMEPEMELLRQRHN